MAIGLLLAGAAHAQTPDSLKAGKSQTPVSGKDSLGRKNENTILNPQKQKQDNSLYYKLNYAGHHLHRAGRNTIAVGGIVVASVAAVLLFNTVLKPKVYLDEQVQKNQDKTKLLPAFLLQHRRFVRPV